MVQSNETGKSREYLQKSLELTTFLSSSMCLGIIAVAGEFVPLFFGDGFEKCKEILTVLMLSCLFVAFANVIRTQYLIPHEIDKMYVISLLFGAVVNFTVNWVMIPRYASFGAGIGTLFAEATVCIYQCLCVRKQIGLGKCLNDVLPYLLAGVLMCFCVTRAGRYLSLSVVPMLTVKILAGIVLYIFFVFLFSGGWEKRKKEHR